MGGGKPRPYNVEIEKCRGRPCVCPDMLIQVDVEIFLLFFKKHYCYNPHRDKIIKYRSYDV